MDFISESLIPEPIWYDTRDSMAALETPCFSPWLKYCSIWEWREEVTQTRNESVKKMVFLYENTMLGLYPVDYMVSLYDLKEGWTKLHISFKIVNYLLVL